MMKNDDDDKADDSELGRECHEIKLSFRTNRGKVNKKSESCAICISARIPAAAVQSIRH